MSELSLQPVARHQAPARANRRHTFFDARARCARVDDERAVKTTGFRALSQTSVTALRGGQPLDQTREDKGVVDK
jgi:hypothetical protein